MLFRSGNPLQGHTELVWSVACSPDGRHIISGSYDRTVRIWDAGTGIAVGDPLKGHTDAVRSVAYSPDGRHIVSGSSDRTIRIWDAKAGAVVGSSLEGYAGQVKSFACSSDRQHIVSGSYDRTIHVWDPLPYAPIGSFSCNPIYPGLYAKPDNGGWVRDSEGGLLYWVPLDIRTGMHSPALLTIPLTSPNRSVSLDFNDFAFGTSWTQIFKDAAF